MAAWEQKTGGKLLAIPHNGNLSNGRMFPLTTFAGDAMTKQWAEDRQRWEPLFEALQMKGQSESHPSLSTTDEFAVNYELWDRGNLTQTPKKPGMIQYVLREALKNGLKAEQDLGANRSNTGWLVAPTRTTDWSPRKRTTSLPSFRPPNRTPSAGTKTP